MRRLLAPALFVLITSAAAEPVRLAQTPALSPDGKTLVFGWRGDLWSVASQGGNARRLTEHPALDSTPIFSPDGSQIAFLSERQDGRQIHLMPAAGGAPRQLTWHSEGYDLAGWTPDGGQLLVSLVRDHSWMRSSRSARLALIEVQQRRAEKVLLDDAATEASLSPDGQKVLFVREGESWWRQGYRGSRAGQIWLLNRADGSCKPLLSGETENRFPLWKPDGSGFYFTRNRDSAYNLCEFDFTSGQTRQITSFKTDSVVFPALSKDGSTLVFRHLADLYRWQPGKEPEPIRIEFQGDPADSPIQRRVLERATRIAFTADGLQMAFVADADLWVMDTELREPRQVTRTPEEERDPVFSPDGKSLWFVSDQGGQADLWKALPASPGQPWWENSDFKLEKITQDPEVESGLQFSPDGKRLAWLKERGDFWLADADGKNARRLFASWNKPGFSFSPDGQWLAYAQSDEWFNSDIWLVPVDGSKPAFNLSRHPDNDEAPAWSPDGRLIAWTGRRDNEEVDIHYVWLRAEDDEQSRRERTLIKAREKLAKAAPKAEPKTPDPKAQANTPAPTKAEPKEAPQAQPAPKPKAEEATASKAEPKAQAKDAPKVMAKPLPMDLEDIHERIRRIRLPNTTEAGLSWSPDSKKLAFAATVEGKRGTYTLEFPDDLKPKLLSNSTLADVQWLKQGNQLVGLSEGLPASLSATGSLTTWRFRALQATERAGRQRAIFDLCWRVMRDHYYDERLGNRDWDAVRAKYTDLAAEAPDLRTVQELVHLMLGELNGSHLGFMLDSSATGTLPSAPWREETAHLGLRFDPDHAGPGWKVRDVLPKGPASHRLRRILPGELLLRIDGRETRPGQDVSELLNGPLERDIRLLVRAADGKEREVNLRPISYTAARGLLYDQWIKANRARVEKDSGGRLGYLHISAMDSASFHKFQEELYAAGAGKDGLIIDVRENGGGSTTDHLLTALTQPRHALTVPRGGDLPGYPQDRKIYTTWDKPVTVLCNQNSFSNAEIFSHAIRLLKRGQVVGTPTAGGVISTGSVRILDVGTLRLPSRGWYGLESGLDMELNGAMPHHVVWPEPGDTAKGIDRQLAKAIEVLQTEVDAWAKRPQPKLQKASERFKAAN